LILWCTDKENPFSPYEQKIDFVFTSAVTLLGAALLVLYREPMIEAMVQNGAWLSFATFCIQALFVSIPVQQQRMTRTAKSDKTMRA